MSERSLSSWRIGARLAAAFAGALLALAARGADALASPPASAAAPAVAFYYGADPPLDELRVFDWAVLEPAHVADPAALPAGTRWFAYVSVGEVEPGRPYFGDIPAAWQRGRDERWGGLRIDQTVPGWPDFLLERVFAPLWAQGWRAFFLDTVDAYQAFAGDDAQRAAQAQALAHWIDRLRARFPGVHLMINRGFEVLGRLHAPPDAVAAESLFDRWDALAQRYVAVPAADRQWLLARLQEVRQRDAIPVVVIDYRPYAERAAARATAQRILAAGAIPWVANPELDTLGVGALEVQPRRIALFADRPANVDAALTEAQRYLSLPLDDLGYVVEAHEVREPLPEHLLDGRYAAIVTWFSSQANAQNPQFEAWLGRQIDGGLKWIAFNELGLDPDGSLAQRLGLSGVEAPRLPLQLQGPWAEGYETKPPRFDLLPVAVQAARPQEVFLGVQGSDGRTADAVARMPWGGFALAPYALARVGPDNDTRWVIDPIEFLRRTLDAPAAPIPDVSSEGGRRLLFAHVDGDGFSSRAELPGAPYAGAVLAQRILRRFPIPTSVSVIEAELTDRAPGQREAATLRALAREAFALPNVEIASHSYSHPFRWQALENNVVPETAEAAWSLPVPGYRFDLQREIGGAADFIDRELAPPGKSTRLFFWTGDSLPDAAALAAVRARGLGNLNGGGTMATRSQPTLSWATGLGITRGRELQVYAPMQNENVYTNLWTGPFYGYERAVETFAFTGAPRRLKPIDLYYHFYSATKPAALAALEHAYAWALAQPTTAVFASDYVAKVQDFYHLALARDWRDPLPHWRVQGQGDLRTLRLDAGLPAADVGRSTSVAGTATTPEGRYVHLAGARAELVLAPAPAPLPYVENASGWIDGWQHSGAELRFALLSYWHPEFTLAQAQGCTVRVDGRAQAPAAGAASGARYVLPEAPATLQAQRHDVEVSCP